MPRTILSGVGSSIEVPEISHRVAGFATLGVTLINTLSSIMAIEDEVSTGDIVLIAASVRGTKGATPGLNRFRFISAPPNTADIGLDTLGGLGSSKDVSAGALWEDSISGIFNVITGGTLFINVSGSSAGSDTTIASLDAVAQLLRLSA